MQTEELTPAHLEAPPQQMSSGEFQRKLYSWFEEKNFVSDLRSYLRVLMINRLKNTEMGNMDQAKPNEFSLSKQALDLVIAEHLLRAGCHYTLSIFSTEAAGMTNQLPFSLFKSHENDTWRFELDSVKNVLELIGISKNSRENVRVCELYSQNYGSLLVCLISAKNTTNSISDLPKKNHQENFDSYLNRIFPILQISPKLKDELINRIHEHFQQEIDRNYSALKHQHARTVEDLKRQITERDYEIKQLLDQQIALQKDGKRMKSELKSIRKQTISNENNIKMKEEILAEKLENLSRLERELKMIKPTCSQKHCTEHCQNNSQTNERLQRVVTRLEEENAHKTLEIEHLHSKINSLIKDSNGSNKKKIELMTSCLLQADLHSEDVCVSKDDSSENLTEEVVRQVRLRLQDLEQESEELDNRFKKLKMK